MYTDVVCILMLSITIAYPDVVTTLLVKPMTCACRVVTYPLKALSVMVVYERSRHLRLGQRESISPTCRGERRGEEGMYMHIHL